jgi:CheY-like chemotaxis protein
MAEKIILWLEDRPKTIERLINHCHDIGIRINIVSTAHQFIEKLEEFKGNICLIIVDIMIYGIKNLESINIKSSDTSIGFNAGWVIIERLLRPMEGIGAYSHIPLAIVSTRTASAEDISRLQILQKGGEDIPYFEKFGLSPNGKTWEKEFHEYLNKINEKCQ